MEASVVMWLWAVWQHCRGDWIGTYRYSDAHVQCLQEIIKKNNTSIALT